jgi:signal transduction histidine kinase
MCPSCATSPNGNTPQNSCAERFSQATINALAAHLCVLDENGLILTVNQAWRDFVEANPPVPADYGLGANYLQVCDSVWAAAFAAGLRAVMRGDMDQFALEYPCHAPRAERWFMARVTRFSGASPSRMVVAHEDITARKQLESQLRDKVATLQTLVEIDREIAAANEPRRIFDLVCQRAAELVQAPKVVIALRSLADDGMALVASHGLGDPRDVDERLEWLWQDARVQQQILSSAEMLEHYSERWSLDRRREHLQRIQTAVKYMTGLLNDILVVAKAEANRLDVEKFCRDMVEEFELMDKSQHPLRFASDATCRQARLDGQLLRHILGKACEAGQVVLRIQDHGLGIPPEDQPRLFETFHRARNARNIPDTGLGLTIVKRSVDLHGGTIEVESQLDVGTTVTVRLPIGLPCDE